MDAILRRNEPMPAIEGVRPGIALYRPQIGPVKAVLGQGGEGFIRASYCYSTQHIKEALARIQRFLNTLKA